MPMAVLRGWTIEAGLWGGAGCLCRPAIPQNRAELWGNDAVLIRAGDVSYTPKHYEALLDALGLSQAKQMLRDGVHNVTLLRFAAPGVPVTVYRGDGVRTPAAYTYARGFTPGDTPDAPSHIEYEYTGDGTVPDRSLSRARVWAVQQQQPVAETRFPNVTHFGILMEDAVGQALVQLLQGVP